MSELLKVSEVAQILGLNPQTVYRKCKRGEIPFLRFGGTIRFDPTVISSRLEEASPDSLQKKYSHKMVDETQALPGFLSRLFWDVEMSELCSDDRLVVERILESGDLPDIVWLFAAVSRERLHKFVKQYGIKRLSKKNFSFWQKMLFPNDEPIATTRGATKALGEARWR